MGREAVATLRVVSYNIHKGIGGVDRRYRLERIIQTIRHCQPDFAFLQEVDEGVPRSRHERQVERLAEETGLPYFAYQRNVRLKVGHYGNAILSRFPLSDIEHLDLTIPLKKRRRALLAHAKLQIGDRHRSVVLVNTHLGLAGFERAMQLQRLLQSRPVRHVRRATPMIVGGDFNDVWASLGSKWMEPAGFRTASKKILTFPAVYPLRPLDRLFFRGDIELDHAFAVHTHLAREASDHLPLVAVLRLKAQHMPPARPSRGHR